jgi:hypothetical protein
MNYWNIWGLLITAAVITLLVLVIVYMNKTSNIENVTVNKYGPPNTYVGATSLYPTVQVLDMNFTATEGPLCSFTVDKSWKAGTKALISGEIVYVLSTVNANATWGVSYSVDNGSQTEIYKIDAISGKQVYLNLDCITTPLNPGDKVEFFLQGTNSGGSGTASGSVVFNTYTPVAA